MAFSFNYEKNTLGDIIGIRNSLGQQVATYTYDAWGNILTKTGTMADINPFRYRGYYYDNETGFYYLQTRYYDPSIRLFINADNYELIGQLSCVLGQLNIYAYANNNPIMLTDESGESIIGMIAATLLFTPVGGTMAQALTSAYCYAGMAVASMLDASIRADMNAIGWNPFNTNAETVMSANKVSFYKGVPVFFISGMGGSMSLGAIFFDKSQGLEVLKHERGHNTQLMSMGIGNYLIQIGIPSIWKNGDATPWELSASMLGNSALANGYSKEQREQAQNYFFRAMIPFINIYNIFYYIHY